MKKTIFLFSIIILVCVLFSVAFILVTKPKLVEFNSIFNRKSNNNENIIGPASLRWEKITPNNIWSARDAHSIVAFQDKIWLFGGLEGGSGKNPVYEKLLHKSDIWASQDLVNWEQITDNAKWGQRRSIGAVVFKDKIFLTGGWENKYGETKNDIWALSNGTDWNLITGSAKWEPREGHVVLEFQDKLWIFGGVDFIKRKTYNDVWYSKDGKSWTEAVSKAPWSPRYDHTVVVFQNKLWLIGGLNFGNDVKKDVWVSEDGINWQEAVNNPPWLARHGHVSLIYKDLMWIIGGWCEYDEKGGLNDSWYSKDGYNWEEVQEEAQWFGREDHAAIVFNNKIIMMGGMADEGKTWSWQNDIWQLEF